VLNEEEITCNPILLLLKVTGNIKVSKLADVKLAVATVLNGIICIRLDMFLNF